MISWLPKKHVNHESVQNLLALSDVRSQYTNRGPVVEKLEEKFLDLMSINSNKSIIAVSSGTSAIQAVIGVLARKLGRIPKIATQALTFPSSAMLYGSNAVIIDIDLEIGGPALNLVPTDTELLIVTNLFGRCVDVKAYQDFCDKQGIFLLFDNAASPLTYVENMNISNFGNAAIISLHHTKTVGFGEGGLVIIDKEYHDDVIDITGFGLGHDRSTWSKFALNGRMSDISAAYILQYINDNQERILSLSEIQRRFIENSGIVVYPSIDTTFQVHNCIPMLCDHDMYENFLSAGIEVKKYYKPLLPKLNSDKIFKSILNLPSHIDMSQNDYDRYKEIIR